MKFKEWLKQSGGAPHIAKRLDISVFTVRAWARGENMPRARFIKRLAGMSRGALTIQGIVRDTTRAQK